jgi:RNA polymerase sigma factor (sigma-70 family)
MNERRQDFELLQRFTRDGEQAAFADVVRRHLDLVFATAMRKVEDAGAAQEVAQNVFAALARKAWRFAPDDSLPAWLHKAALLESKSWLRGELGRRRREEAAAELGTTMKTSEDQPAFHALVPLLDEALLSLREKDRTALLLRFYESQSLREVGAAAGVSEDAARMRVQSALEKLTEFFKRRGFKTASVAVATAALQHTAVSTSTAMVNAVAGVALQVAPPALAGLGALLARLASLSKVQTAAVCVALTAVPVGWQLNARQAAENEVKRQQALQITAQNDDARWQAELARAQAEAARLEQSLAQANEAAARAATAAQAFANWKQNVRAQISAPDYRWSDESAFVRIPKAILPQVSKWTSSQPFAPPGEVEPFAREFMGLTSAEHQALEAVLQRHFAEVEATKATSVTETNMTMTKALWPDGRGLAARYFEAKVPGVVVKQRSDRLLSALRTALGEERWPQMDAFLEHSRAGVYSTMNTRLTLNLDDFQGSETLTVILGTDAQGKLLWNARGGNGGMTGSQGGTLSMFLPEGHPERAEGGQTLATHLSEGMRQRALAWLQEQAAAHLAKKETP